MQLPHGDIPGSGSWKSVQPINKGWSTDEKYCIEGDQGQWMLLRLNTMSQYTSKRREFDALQRLEPLGLPVSKPIAFGVCGEGTTVYSLLSWIPGEDVRAIIGGLPESEDYRLGYQAGEILRVMHGLAAPMQTEPWAKRFNRKIDRNIQWHEEGPAKIAGAQHMLRFIEENRCLLETRQQQTLQHGDYHIGNMVFDGAGGLGIIDFNRCDYGDPWEEFNRIVWCAESSPLFASGRINGYFCGCVPEEFFRLLALYMAVNQLAALAWAAAFGPEEVKSMLEQAQQVLEWFHGFREHVPSWYVPDFQA